MSPTPRRVKKTEVNAHKKRDRAMAVIGLIVVASMFLALVVTPGTIQNPQPSLPTSGAPSAEDMLTAIAEQATIQAIETALAEPATPTPTATATPSAGGLTPSPAATR